MKNNKTIFFLIYYFFVLISICYADLKNSPITINSQKALYLREKNIIKFSGKVIVKGQNLKVECEKLDVYLKKMKKSQNTIAPQKDIIKKMIATHNVHIFIGDKEGFCERAEYDFDQQKLVLLKKVRLIQNKNEIRGDKLIIDLKNNKSEIFSSKSQKVEIIFYPDNSTTNKENEE